MEKNKKYEYHWVDCMTEPAWTNKDELDSMLDKKLKKPFINIGFFLKKYKGYYVFTEGYGNWCEDDESYFNITFIPIKQVIKFFKLKP